LADEALSILLSEETLFCPAKGPLGARTGRVRGTANCIHEVTLLQETAMRIAVMGSGGIGGYLGARLAQAGEDVIFIARGSHLEAMQQKGLRVESPLGEIHLRDVTATETPADVGFVDIVVFAVKAYDTDSAAAAIVPLVGPATRVVTGVNVACPSGSRQGTSQSGAETRGSALVQLCDARASRLSSLRLLFTRLKVRAPASLHDNAPTPGIEGAARRKCAKCP
jgi:hypothetical protein